MMATTFINPFFPLSKLAQMKQNSICVAIPSFMAGQLGTI
jgi:hypothetical protein